ncbi:MAG: cellulase family glycosylhydrolase [Anaerolineae bacterium]|nr:cellulase family glycosylhydrolase [Anaerolineae bacterium]
MPKRKSLLIALPIPCLLVIVLLVTFHWIGGQGDVVAQAEAIPSLDSSGRQEAAPAIQAGSPYTVYLPVTIRLFDPAWQPIWGTQVTDYNVLDKAEEAGMAWIRITAYWKNIEPTDDNYDWSSLDNAISQSIAAGLTPMVGIVANPTWADADDTHCGPLKDNQYLTDFVTDLVNRYKGAPYNVKYWEIGNEVDHNYDVSHQLYPGGGIGCWADLVPQYVEFMQVAYTAIKSADPNAHVILGGLAMLGYSEIDDTNFLRHVLQNGGGPYFDIVAFHFGETQDHAWYTCADSDRAPGHTCQSVEGLQGKAQIVRNTLTQEGWPDKTVILNELGFHCEPCDSARQEEHARWVVKAHARALAENLPVVIWFTLNYPGFHGSSLLNSDGSARPAYNVYPVMASELRMLSYKRTIDGASEFGVTDLEGYVFGIDSVQEKSLMWTNGSTPRLASYPASSISTGQLRVVDKYGNARTLTDNSDDGTAGDGYISVQVTEDPIYVYTYP